jgi:type IV pilus assembly protein PilE
MKRSNTGFTLIEMMIVVTLIGVIAAIAIPNYNTYVLRSHRADARNFLLSVSQRLEQNYTLTGTYLRTQGSLVNNINNAWITNSGFGSVPSAGTLRYNIVFNGGAPVDAATYVLQAVPAGPQVDDRCGTLVIDQAGRKGAGPGAVAVDPRNNLTTECWGR